MLAKISFFMLLILGLSFCQDPIDDDNVKKVCDGLLIEECVCGTEAGDSIQCSDLGVVLGLTFECDADNKGKVSLAEEIAKIDSLVTLSITECEITGTVPDLSKLENLETLDLSGNKFTGEVPAVYVDDTPALSAVSIDVSDNCFTSCKNIGTHEDGGDYTNNPFLILDECKPESEDPTPEYATRCVDVLMESFKMDDDGEFAISDKALTLQQTLEIWIPSKITHDVSFNYGSSPLFKDVGDNGLVEVTKKLKMTISEEDLTQFRDNAEKGDDDDKPVYKTSFTLYESTEEDIFEDDVDISNPELEEDESIEAKIVHTDKKKYEVELVYSSSSQIAFLFAIIAALSLQLFM